MTPIEFLLARIAEDEAVVAEWPTEGEWGAHPDGGMWMDIRGHPLYAPRARVLAECKTKRAIRALVVDLNAHDTYTEAVRDVVSLLCRPYADHPDYPEVSW